MGSRNVWIAGSYQSDFARNYAREGLEISDMVAEAVAGTLDSAGVAPADVQAIHVGNAFGQLFTGQGQDARHAWFGFLDGEHKWRLDAGRYAEQRFVTGNALDPQNPALPEVLSRTGAYPYRLRDGDRYCIRVRNRSPRRAARPDAASRACVLDWPGVLD